MLVADQLQTSQSKLWSNNTQHRMACCRYRGGLLFWEMITPVSLSTSVIILLLRVTCKEIFLKSSRFRYASLALSRIFQVACLTEDIINVITLYLTAVLPTPDLREPSAHSRTPALTGSSATATKPPGTSQAPALPPSLARYV